MQPSSPILVCLYEDRIHQIPGVKLLLLTLNRYCPSWPIRLRFPGIPESFRTWLQRIPKVDLQEDRLPLSGSYNVKPTVLLEGLLNGSSGNSSACLWLDTDVLVNGSLEFIAAAPPETLISTQDPWEYNDGSSQRCSTWGMTLGRSLPGPLNSAVVRVTRNHEGLLRAWQRVISTEAYLAEQAKPVGQRNRHMLGDQDALSALLASSEFADVPVHLLRHSTEILQHHGAGAYRPQNRWSNFLHGMPPLIHAMGSVKPWDMPSRPGLLRSPRDYYERTYLELSPYLHYARQYRHPLEEETAWMDIRTATGMLGTLAALNHPALKGWGQAIMHRTLSSR